MSDKAFTILEPKRLGKSEEVVGGAKFLYDDDCAYVISAAFQANGGLDMA